MFMKKIVPLMSLLAIVSSSTLSFAEVPFKYTELGEIYERMTPGEEKDAITELLGEIERQKRQGYHGVVIFSRRAFSVLAALSSMLAVSVRTSPVPTSSEWRMSFSLALASTAASAFSWYIDTDVEVLERVLRKRLERIAELEAAQSE